MAAGPNLAGFGGQGVEAKADAHAEKRAAKH